MDSNAINDDDDVYRLITDLAKQLIRTHRTPSRSSNTSEQFDTNSVKKLRSKAFEILLNKSGQTNYQPECRVSPELDATTEILKHAFILRTAFRLSYDAAMLERLLEELTTDQMEESRIAPILIFLIQLKTFKRQSDSLTNIFSSVDISVSNISFDSKNPAVIEVCPLENLLIPGIFASALEAQKTQLTHCTYSALNIEPRLPCMFGFANLQSIEFDRASGTALTPNITTPSVSALTFPNEWSVRNLTPTSNFIPEITMEVEKDEHTSEKALVTSYSHLNYIQVNEPNVNSDSTIQIWKPEILDKSEYDPDAIWNQVEIIEIWESNLRTWELFGQKECKKEPAFITDWPNAAIHLARIKETCCLPLLLTKTIESIPLLEEVLAVDFLSDLKSLFLGIESNSFKCIEQNGFELRKHISVYGISPRSLEIVCQDALVWGNCYKFLTTVVRVEPQTGKLIQDGLIFKAMCTSLQELLLYYRACLLRIASRHKASEGLLSLLEKVRPVAKLVVESSRLCGYAGFGQSTIIEGNDILSHIYQEVVKVTDTRVAMVFYSILKSCCEVYFRFLQKWMFEGLCDDVYGEFMIKSEPQFLRNRGHKFWTKSFCIANNDAVPGFLKNLTSSILQCGKAVRLLRICDIKNPVCNIFITEQPEVKVCLSIAMLRDQSFRCKEYDEKGKAALGPILSLASAIEERKRKQKETAELVIAAQRNTMLKLNEQREEALRDIARTKRNLLASLKDQVEEVNLRKKKEKEEEMREDCKNLQHLEQTQKSLQTERQNMSRYYDALQRDAEKRQIRSEWRAKRMSHYEKRITAIRRAREDFLKTSSESLSVEVTEDKESPVEVKETVETVSPTEETGNNKMQASNADESFEDENKNIMQIELPGDDTITVNVPNQITDKSQENTESTMNLPMNYIYRKQNETSTLQNFLREEALKELGNKIFVKTVVESKAAKLENAEIPYTDLIGALNTCNDNQPSIERPTYLSFNKLDNMPTALTTGLSENNVFRKKYDMTPNNNQPQINCSNEVPNINLVESHNDGKSTNHMIPCLSSNDNDFTFKGTKNVNCNRMSDAETPMSCTTDKFTSSTHSLQASSPFTIDIDSNDTPVSSQPPETPISLIQQRNSPDDSHINEPLYRYFDTNHHDWFVKPVKSRTTPSLTISDVEIIDHTSLQVYLKKSILIPLEIQSRLVNNAIIKYFLKEHDLLSHFHSLRSYFFLLNGEFAKTLTDSLYSQLYKISIPVELFNSTTLTNLLERALVNSFTNVYANSELLSLSAVDTPEQLQISDPNALDCLCLNYKISWPLNIILDDTIMAQYGKVFKFLITSGRVSWVLQEDFNIMKRERNAAYSQQYHKLQLYRHAMTEFMNALHNYLTCSVLQWSWAEFEKDLQQASTLDQIYMSHVKYIKKILSRCMLNLQGEKMRMCLNNIFKVILKFHNRLAAQTWVPHKSGVYVHPNFKKLEQLYGGFCEYRAYMAYLAFKLATSGYQPHLMHFLNALNINHVYDLTVKSHHSATNS